MREFRMPSLGADMTSGILTEWLVQPGQQVHRGDIVAVVETDKGAIEIEIFEDAVIAELLVQPDAEVPVGALLARLGTAGEAVVRAPREAEPAAAQVEPEPAVRAPPAPAVPQRPPAPPVAPGIATAGAAAAAGTAGERRKVSPAARKHAREHGLDLATVVATGHGGVVTVADVESALAGAPPAAVTAAPVARRAPGAGESSPMRRAIAAAMSRSKREIPHYYMAQTIDVEPALRWLEARNRERPIAQRLLPGVLLLKAAARAARDTPALNGTWQDDRFVPAERVNLGVVIGLRGGGLAAPTLPDAADRDLDDLMAALRDVTQRARGGRLRSSEMGAASITVSSLGDTAVDTLFPVIHPPQVAIVGFGGIVRRPWVVDDGLHVRRVVTATVAGDHRASDGHVGARYLTSLARHLEQPEQT